MKPAFIINQGGPKRKPGDVPAHRVPVYDHKGNLRGHVGKQASESVAARILGRTGLTLKKSDKRPEWHGDPPPLPPKRRVLKPDLATKA